MRSRFPRTLSQLFCLVVPLVLFQTAVAEDLPWDALRMEAADAEPTTSATLARVRAASNEADLLRLGAELRAAGTDIDASERGRLAVAARLSESGTAESLAYLDQEAASVPRVLTQQPGCRQPALVPLYPFHFAASRAAFAIRERDARARIDARHAAGDDAWLAEAATLDADSPALSAALAAIHDLPASHPRVVGRATSGLSGPAAPRSEMKLYVESCLRAGICPDARSLRALPDDLALRMLDRVDELSAAARAEFYLRARQHPGIASAAALRDPAVATLPLREQLARDGSSAAARLAAATDTSTLPALKALLADPSEEARLRRLAALALMLNGNDDARGALRAARNDGTLDPVLRRKIGAFLGP